MKQSFKRFILLAMVFMACISASAYDFSVEYKGNTFYFNKIGSDEVSLTYKSLNTYGFPANSYNSRTEIPSNVTYNGTTYRVTKIGTNTFGPGDIYSLVIPANVSSVASNAFHGKNLHKVFVLSNSVPTGFADSGLFNSTNLTLFVGNNDFDQFASQTELVVLPFLSSMFEHEGAYYTVNPSTRTADVVDYDYSTSNISIPNKITFTHSSGSSVELSVTNIKKQAFYRGNALKEITIGGEVQAIEDQALSYCSLESVTFSEGENPISIGKNGNSSMFSASTFMKYINIYRPLEYDKSKSPFYGLYLLRTINVGGKETTIYENEFGSTFESETNPGYPPTTLNVFGSVNKIEQNAFKGCHTLANVMIDADNTEIGASAFEGLKYLSSVTLGRGIGNIGDAAFKDCTAIAVPVTINPYNNSTIGNSAFENCNMIKTLTIGNTVTSIGDYAFKNNSTAATINLGNGLTGIGEGAFQGCSKFSQINLCENITAIGKKAFAGCSALASIAFPSKLKLVNDSICTDCSNLKTVTMGNNVTFVGNFSFQNDVALQSITLSSATKTIGSRAFEKTTALSTISLPAGLEVIGAYAFTESGVKSVTIPEGVSQLKVGTFESSALKSIETSKVANIRKNCFANSALESMTIHPVVAAIEEGAFKGCTSLATLTIEESQAELSVACNASGQGMFFDCKLDNTTISRPLAHPTDGAGYSPFAGNTTMQNVTINGKATTVMASMFRDCSALDKVTLGADVRSIGEYAFASSGVRTINIPAKVTVIPTHCFDSASRLATMTIPNTVTSIGSYAYTASGLQTLTIPSSVKTVSNYTFYNCKSLKSITLREGVQTIEQYAFAGSTLLGLTVPKSVTRIADATFKSCTKFKTIRFEDSTTTISLGINQTGKGLFSDCPLESAYVGRTLSFGGGTANGYSPFYANKTLKTVEFGDIPTEIRPYEFAECATLKTVILGDGISQILERGLYRCVALEEFEVGASILTIGDETFSDCTALKTLKSWAVNPPVCGTRALDDIDRFKCELFIPAGSSAAYAAADQWKDFFFVSEFDATIYPSYMEMNESSASLKTGETLQLSVTCYPTNATVGAITWSSTDTSVATVNANGKVTAVGEGEATITATEASGVTATCLITVASGFTLGDVNNDGEYSVPDVSMTVEYILGREPANGVREAADVNQDGEISVPDVSIIVSYILAGKSVERAPQMREIKAKSEPMYDEALYCAEISKEDDNHYMVRLGLTGASDYTAAQFEVLLPMGMKIADARMTEQNHSHEVAFSETEEGVSRVVAYSIANKNFNGFIDLLVENTAASSGEIEVRNVRLASNNDGAINSHHAEGLTIGLDATGIAETMNAEGASDASTYDLSGRKVNVTNSLPKGVYVVNGKKVIK